MIFLLFVGQVQADVDRNHGDGQGNDGFLPLSRHERALLFRILSDSSGAAKEGFFG